MGVALVAGAGRRAMEEERGSALAAESALEKNVAELTVMDVYDIASLVGHEFERVIDQHGCEAIARLMPKVVRVLEILEVLVSRHHVAPELDELRLELDRLRVERMDRIEKERKHQKVGSGLSLPVQAVGAHRVAVGAPPGLHSEWTLGPGRWGRRAGRRPRRGTPGLCHPGDWRSILRAEWAPSPPCLFSSCVSLRSHLTSLRSA